MENILFPLTLTQHDIYLDQRRRHGSPLYNIGGYIEFGEIDVPRLAAAHRRLISECDIFGLRILRAKDDVFQYICSTRTTSLPVLDFTNENHPADAAAQWLISLFETTLEIENAELFRAYVVRISDDHYRYVGLTHHMMMDGWGFSNWATLLCQFYNDLSSKVVTGTAWEEIAADDQSYAASQKYTVDRSYWREHLKTIPQLVLSPRYQYKFTEGMKNPSRRRTIEMSRPQFNLLKSLAGDLGSGIAPYFLAMLAVYFSNSSGQNQLVFGVPFHNRRSRPEKQMLGVFTGIKPLYVDMSDGKCTFSELIRNICKQQKAGFRHQRYPLGHIIRDIADLGDRRSLYDIGFNYLKLGDGLSFAGFHTHLTYVSNNHDATPFMATLCEHGEQGPIQLELDCNPAYFDDADTLLLTQRLSFLLESLYKTPDVPVCDLEILSEHEIRQLLQGFGGGPLRDTSNRYAHQLFEERVTHGPDAIAVESGGEIYTYAELNRRANRVAHHLIQLGVKPESLVGIYMERTANLLIAVLGILKAGGAYVALDRSYPQERIRTILEDGPIQLVLTDRRSSGCMGTSGVRWIVIDEMEWDASPETINPDPALLGLAPSNLAYVIYTSGSTGRPKGVQICHSNVVALLDWARATYTREELDRVLASTSLSFDLSVFEMFAPLSAGGRCVVVKDALELLMHRLDVSLINTVPSAVKALIEQNAVPGGVLVINLAGECLPLQVVNDLLSAQKCKKVFNLYGPSEDTTYTTYAVFDRTISNAPDIGRAIPGTRLYILSPNGKLTPSGMIGELHIAGSGIARGYLNRPDLTAEKFISNEFVAIEGDRMYRTGDLVRYRSDGALEFLGRSDDQVKIRGFRIELGEIERSLEQLDGVKTAVVVSRERSALERSLAAYVQRKQRETETGAETPAEVWVDKLREALLVSLPGYMVPSSITVLDEIPLTPNGKADKKALLALQDVRRMADAYTAPRSALERVLADLWAELLNLEGVSIHSNFFALGGHSLLATTFVSNLHEILHVELSLETFFRNPTIALLSVAMVRENGDQLSHAAEMLDAVTHLSEEEVEAALRAV